MRLVIWSFLLFFCLSANVVFAQFNFKVGYGLAYTPANQNNEVIAAFNQENAYRLESDMADLHFLHGIILGVRYQFENLGLELNWESRSNNVRGLGEDDDGSLYKRELFYNLSNLSLGLETYFGNKGIGLAIGRRNSSIKADIASSDFKKTILQDNQMNLKIYWMQNFRGGDFIGLSLRPYFEWPLEKFDLTSGENPDSYELHDFLEISPPESNISDRFPIVGITILFYNGWQNEFN